MAALEEKVLEYEKTHAFIALERDSFGLKGGFFDFESMNMNQMKEDHEKILEC